MVKVTGSICDLSSRNSVKLIETVSSIFQGKLNIPASLASKPRENQLVLSIRFENDENFLQVNNAAISVIKDILGITAEDMSTISSTIFESVFHLLNFHILC